MREVVIRGINLSQHVRAAIKLERVMLVFIEKELHRYVSIAFTEILY